RALDPVEIHHREPRRDRPAPQLPRQRHRAERGQHRYDENAGPVADAKELRHRRRRHRKTEEVLRHHAWRRRTADRRRLPGVRGVVAGVMHAVRIVVEGEDENDEPGVQDQRVDCEIAAAHLAAHRWPSMAQRNSETVPLQPMRLLHVVPTYLPATRYGGPIFAVHGLCRALARRGHEVHVFTTNVDGDGVSDVPLDRPVNLDGVHVHYFGASLRRIYFSPGMRRMLEKRVRDFDVVHAHSVFLWPTAAAARAAHARGVPYVISPRGMLVNELIERKSRFAKRAWIR